jgi:hypothetical protein
VGSAPCVQLGRLGARDMTRGLARGDREWSLNDGRIPNVRVVRVHASTGHNREEGNRRASRNGPVSDLPPEIPHATIRDFCIAVGWGRTARAASGGGTQGTASERHDEGTQ